MTPRTLRGADILCVGTTDSEAALRTSQRHLISTLAQHNRVLFVELLDLRRPRLRRIGGCLRKTFAGPRATDDLHVLSTPVLPFQGTAAAGKLNARLLLWSVRRALERLGIREPVLWSYAPHAEVLIDLIRPSMIVYHCVDDIDAHEGVERKSFRAAEKRFARRADVVLASTPPLAQRMRQLSENVIEPPNDAGVVTAIADAVDRARGGDATR